MDNTTVHIIVNRYKFTHDSTIGELSVYVNNKEVFNCYTLEDTLRPFGIKVKGSTGMPNCKGKITTRFSPSFKREMLMFYTDDNDTCTVSANGISFKYNYFHGGNTHKNTEGCVLVAHTLNGNGIYGTVEKELYNLIKPYLDLNVTVTFKLVTTLS